MQNDPYRRAAEKFATAAKLESVRMLINWDAQTHMPAGGAWARGEQAGALAEVSGDLIGNEEIGDLLSEAEGFAGSLTPAERANLKEMQRLWVRAMAVPRDLMIARERMIQPLRKTWVNAKRENDFAAFARAFKPLLEAQREIAAALGEALGLDPYDAMIEDRDPGVTTALIDPIFDDLAAWLPPIIEAVRERQARWPAPINFGDDFPVERQKALSQKLAEIIGHSSEHTRIDEAHHPFSMPHSPGDVRFTTRYDEKNFRYAMMATIHEAGHSMYELNLPRSLAFSPAGCARGATAHESQSLMLEMMACRAREFIRFIAPVLREHLGGEERAFTPANLLNYLRRVDDDFIRVEADEISYPLHVILRYRLERAMMAGDLAVEDLPGAWNETFEQLFARTPPDHARGVLQDVHWASGYIGYFPNYALGEVLAAQLYERATMEDPSILE
ncbi:MAG TPA: carboxypeptidase M32, partial [Alphaproteobacteria bacterium]|nr:carboxypeptidase M32 [Alphaproteobacteria bacterium]